MNLIQRHTFCRRYASRTIRLRRQSITNDTTTVLLQEKWIHIIRRVIMSRMPEGAITRPIKMAHVLQSPNRRKMIRDRRVQKIHHAA